MKALLDTHTIIWAGTNSARLSKKARHFIEIAEEIYVSAASAWEIAMRVRAGRWPEAEPFEANFSAHMAMAGYNVLSISVEDALRAGRLAGDHGDPLDRMIAAQALALDIPLISIDAKLEGFGVRRIW